ncbi:hypothetical protein M231_08049 [Tremella mesenterica]|uniref:Uncharacterized protein n=1 Tax=Tremella mesenterica TaxID=5217 RepID=A0A4Q1B9R1_TREME|nr:uncharacterized protein TREMEDRAFT_56387 [Tremella mesenterica DSM 1558]EIW71290.1 hypothetical protein TREMEDRAFT_56387 [Tremella mesenterica DSM 1558]RXK34697.1 hypothetical protein M231_08049 [Tremella mesenterica]
MSELKPGLRVMAQMSVRALDSLPLPILIVLFFACLALFQWPFNPPPPVLPTHTPPSGEKDRLSPLPFSHLLSPNTSLPPNPYPQPHPSTHPLTYHAKLYVPCNAASSGGRTPGCRSGGRAPTRTRRLVGRMGTRWSMPLGPVEEVEGESSGEVC